MTSKAKNVNGYAPNWENIASLIDDGYIRVGEHPENSELLIYNYTQKTQYDQKWTKDTLLCRGLISKNRSVVSRPFQKFFNYSEFDASHANVLKGPWNVFEKMDGSLGILYEFADGDYRIATRGAFASEQALWGTAWLKKNHPNFQPAKGETWLFEIIYPTNRIVVDYGDKEGLVLLDVLDSDTGHRMEPDKNHPFEVCDYHGLSETIPSGERDNCEGYVIVNSKGFRVKIKHEEYVRLHKIITGCSNRTVWEYLKDGKPFDELLSNVPDEFYSWLEKTRESLLENYSEVEDSARNYFNERPADVDRKELAKYFTEYDHPFLCFLMLDDKDYSEKIWKMIKPERALPFIEEV